MTGQGKPYPRVEMLINIFVAWLKHRRELNEVRQMDRSDLNRVASDLWISPSDLNTLVHQGPHAAHELPYLLRALSIDKAKLAHAGPLVLRDLERVCALCYHKGQCDRDLIAGTSAEHYHRYCPNAPTIDRLGQPALPQTDHSTY
jgi:hypothetical protein